MWSVPSRRSELSTSWTIHRRELPRWFGSSSIGTDTFVASTTSSRRPLSALPNITSGVRAAAHALVQGVDRRDLLRAQREVEEVEVLGDPVRLDLLGDRAKAIFDA